MAERVRLSLDSAPSGKGKKFDWSSRGTITDEALRTINPVNMIQVRISNFERTIGLLALEAPELIASLQYILGPLKQLLTGELKQPIHGWGDAALRSVLPELPPETPNPSGYTSFDYTVAAAECVLQPDLDFLAEEADGISDEDLRGAPKEDKRAFKRASRTLKNESYQDIIQQAKETVLLNWLPDFLKVWARRQSGAMRVDNGVLTIYTHNKRHSEIYKADAWNIYQDGTATPEYLSWWIGVQPNQILTIEQEVPKHNNLTIVQVFDLGQVSKIRSKLCQQRVTAIRTELLQRHPDIRFIDFKYVDVVPRNSVVPKM